MGRIGDKKKYPLKKKINKKDMFIGTDSENDKETVNFQFEDVTKSLKEDIKKDLEVELEIPNSTAQLINNGEDGINKFVDTKLLGVEIDKSEKKVLLEVDGKLGNLKDETNLSLEELDENLKKYADAKDEATRAQIELEKKALEGKLTDSEALLLQELENQKREQEKKLEDVSETLTTDVDELKKRVDKESEDVKDAISDFQDQLNNIPTGEELNDMQIESLKFLLYTIEGQYNELDHKITSVIRDKFLPAGDKPELEQLKIDSRLMYEEVETILLTAIQDNIITEDEKNELNAKLLLFNNQINVVNEKLLIAYDNIENNREKIFEQKIKDSIVEVDIQQQFSKDGVTWHDPPFKEGDVYMRMRNGEYGDWTDPIKIAGESGADGVDGKYQANEFAKNTSLTDPPLTGWQDTPPASTANEYIWMRVGEVIPPATTPSSWTAIRLTGGKGPAGNDGLRGPEGIEGPKGEDGKSTYTHIAYADTSTGGGFSQEPEGKDYVGMYVDNNPTDSSDPKKYKWSLIKGADGTQGIAGKAGADGKTPYFHTAWSNSQDGKVDFSTTVSEGKDYIGTYTDFVQADSTDPTKYNWTLTKGEKGDKGDRGLQGLQGADGTQGIAGKAGADGKTSYTHIAYADNSTGGGFSQNPANKTYIGMYVDFVQEDSTTPSRYKWSLIKGADGAQGIAGKAGADGKTPYFHTAWANSEDGKTGFSTTVSKDKSFIGTYTDFVQADSTDPTKYKWSKTRGDAIVSATEPTGKYVGMVWIDTSKSPIQQKYWNGTIWILTGITDSDIDKAIKEANSKLETSMKSALEDGIISNNEARAIAENISSLDLTKKVLDSQYTVIYNDKNLSAAKKTDLQGKKTDFDLKHTALMNVCVTISKKTKVTTAEINDYKAKQTAYNTSLSALSKSLEEAQDDILKNSIGGIEIGGRNYLGKYGFSDNLNNYNISKATKLYTVANAYGTRGMSVTMKYVKNRVKDHSKRISLQFSYKKISGKCIGFGGHTDGLLAHNYVIVDGVRSIKGYTDASSAFVADDTKVHNVEVYFSRPLSEFNDEDLLYIQANRLGSEANSGSFEIYDVRIVTGDKYVDWTPAPEDIDSSISDAVNNAAQAKNIANAANGKVNFLTATSDPKNGLISGGALLVGDAVGNNAGVVGVTDDGVNSIRFYAGATYANKKVAPFRVQNNGKMYALDAIIKGSITANSGNIGGFIIESNMIRSANNSFKWYGTTGVLERFDKNGVLRHREGVDANGDPEDTWYDSKGNVMYTIDSRGTHWSQFTPESYSVKYLWRIATTTTYTKTVLQAALNSDSTAKKKGTSYLPADGNHPATWSGIVTKHKPANEFKAYTYSAGNNPESHSNKQYEGFVFVNENKLGAKIADGWYLSNTLQGTYFSYRIGDTIYTDFVNCVQILGGKIVKTVQESVTFNADCNFRPNETSTPELALGTITVK